MTKNLAASILALAFVFVSTETKSQEKTVPVLESDLKVFVDLARQEKCRSTTDPKVLSSPVVLIHDRDGRVYVKTQDNTVKINWCNYEIVAKNDLSVQNWVAPPTPPKLWSPKLLLSAGFNLRSLWSSSLQDSANVGLSFQAIVIHSFSPYIAVGSKGFGGGLGYYLTPTLSAQVGYLSTWSFVSSPYLGVSLALW